MDTDFTPYNEIFIIEYGKVAKTNINDLVDVYGVQHSNFVTFCKYSVELQKGNNTTTNIEEATSLLYEETYADGHIIRLEEIDLKGLSVSDRAELLKAWDNYGQAQACGLSDFAPEIFVTRGEAEAELAEILAAEEAEEEEE